jgi:hypothetical protein
LTKSLGLDWRLGERFFREHLVDGDVATTPATGNGSQAPVPTRGRTARSAWCARRRASIPTGPTCAATSGRRWAGALQERQTSSGTISMAPHGHSAAQIPQPLQKS